MEKNTKSSKGFTKDYEDGTVKVIIGIMDKVIKIKNIHIQVILRLITLMVKEK